MLLLRINQKLFRKVSFVPQLATRVPVLLVLLTSLHFSTEQSHIYSQYFLSLMSKTLALKQGKIEIYYIIKRYVIYS